MKQALTSGFDRAFISASVVTLVALVVAFAIPRMRPVSPAGTAAPAPETEGVVGFEPATAPAD